jgi:hypothetical protein
MAYRIGTTADFEFGDPRACGSRAQSATNRVVAIRRGLKSLNLVENVGRSVHAIGVQLYPGIGHLEPLIPTHTSGLNINWCLPGQAAVGLVPRCTAGVGVATPSRSRFSVTTST